LPVLLVAFGLTPLGATFVHAIASSGTYWQVRVAMLIIIVAVWDPPLLPSFWWLRLARRSCPALVRARSSGRSRLPRQALAELTRSFRGLAESLKPRTTRPA
jgi:hypothetical protein